MVTLGTAAIPYGLQRYARVPAPATLTIESTPAGRHVVVDGVPRGATPATMTLAHGEHQVVVGEGQVVFTHPQYGERRQSVIVTAGAPARVSVDFTK